VHHSGVQVAVSVGTRGPPFPDRREAIVYRIFGAISVLALTGCSDHILQGPEVVDQEWTVGGDVDIVVFGDTSESMQDTLDTLADSVEVMVTRLQDVDVDWQLIAVTGPDGCGQNGILTQDTPDWTGKFREGILTPPGEDLVDEWGLHNAAQALAASVEGGCNEGFLRPDAHLHLMFISDEDDNSPGWDGTDPEYWRQYTDTYLAAKEDASKVRLSAVAGPAPIGCSYADYGRGYAEAVEAVGGEFLSICDDWALETDALADTSVVQATFALAKEPLEDSVRVFVDGLERVDGWHHDHVRNEVAFDDDAPYAGQGVRVSYVIGY
jgi:hypothetical protein